LRSLIKGTSVSDGLGITFAICESLLKTEAYTFLATHFKELSSNLEAYSNVLNLHLKVAVSFLNDEMNS
jgi:DNA mismatch repair protein MSH4